MLKGGGRAGFQVGGSDVGSKGKVERSWKNIFEWSWSAPSALDMVLRCLGSRDRIKAWNGIPKGL